MNSRIFFIVESPLCQRDYFRYGIDHLIRNNYEVIVWDFTPVFRPLFHKTYVPPDPIEFSNYHVCNSKSEIKRKLSSLGKKDVVMCSIRNSLKNHFVFAYLKNSGCYFGTRNATSVPTVVRTVTIYKRLKALIIRTFTKPSCIVNSIYMNLVLPVFYNNLGFQFIIFGGWINNNSNAYSAPKKSKIDYINAHSLDYDLYLDSLSDNKVALLEGNYAIFLDEYVPFHPDNLNRELDAEDFNYYPDLNNFFLRIENEFHLKVVIAAHPRANYQGFNPFGGRKIFYGETHNLVKYSKLVLTHASTANNFTILYEKPILFINSKKYSEYFQASIESFAKELDRCDIDISSSYQLNYNDSLPDKSNYLNYKAKYIKDHNSPEIYFTDIFIKHLKGRN